MTSGSRGSPRKHLPHEARRGFIAWVLALSGGCVPLVSPSYAQAMGVFDLDALLAAISKIGPSRATFQERKFLQQFDAPIDSSGELLFHAPSTLVMRTLHPRVESMRVDGQTLTLERGRSQRTLQLAEHPEIAVFVEPIRAALAGDRAALERGYVTRLQGDAAQWKLLLMPKAGAGAAADQPGGAPGAVASLLLSGRQGQVRQVEVRLADGDYSVMNIEPAAER